MTETRAADMAFQPKVWADHIEAYFVKKLVFGAFAMQDNTLTQAPGETVNFPYFKSIGAAEEPTETGDLTISNLSDDSFSATVKEVGKAVGFTDKSLRVSSAKKDIIYNEAQSQIGRVMAEKVDLDLVTEMNQTGNHSAGFVGAAAADVCTAGNLLTSNTLVFGDRTNEMAAIFMHSLHYLAMMKDGGTGFLKADANDPMFNVQGFMGRLFGAALVVVDTVPAGPTLGGKKSYYSFTIKPNAYGFMTAEELQFEKDRDIIGRKTYITATQWYAVKGFHSKISADDKRVARALFATEVAA